MLAEDVGHTGMDKKDPHISEKDERKKEKKKRRGNEMGSVSRLNYVMPI